MQAQKFELSPSVRSNPHCILGKKVSPITFTQILPKVLSAACIFCSYTIMTYLKRLGGTKSFNTKQCPSGLSPRSIPQVSHFLPKMSPPFMFLCCTHQVCTFSLLPWTFLGNPGDRGETYPTAKNLFIFLTREKSPLIDLHLPISKVLFLPHQISIFM